jgi:hypothetical protein
MQYLLAIRDESRPPGAVILYFKSELERQFVANSIKENIQYATSEVKED